MVSPTPKLFTLVLASLMLGYGPTAMSAPGELLCCVDDSGRRTCGDILPSQCVGKAHKVYNGQGILIREVSRPLTLEERAAQKEAERQKQLAEAAAREQQRKDQALLETYPTLQDIDRMQERAEVDVRQAIADAEAKVAEAKQRRRHFENEAEFYKSKTMPPDISKGLRDGDVEIRAQTDLIEAKQRELSQIRVKYAEDRRRYIEISRRPLRR